jgi:hypothetical protein
MRNKRSRRYFKGKIERTPRLIDRQIKILSRMQINLLFGAVSSDDYNEISDKIGDLKEFMVNCKSYMHQKR